MPQHCQLFYQLLVLWFLLDTQVLKLEPSHPKQFETGFFLFGLSCRLFYKCLLQSLLVSTEHRHHRWSQIYLINPEATVPAINFEVGGFLDSPEGVLKLAHLSIAAVDDYVPLKQADSATDIYKTGGNREQIKKILSQTVSDEMAEVLKPYYKAQSKEQVIDKIADNAEALHKNTAGSAGKGPIRGLMPQTAEKSPETNKMAAISKGAVNWNPKNK